MALLNGVAFFGKEYLVVAQHTDSVLEIKAIQIPPILRNLIGSLLFTFWYALSNFSRMKPHGISKNAWRMVRLGLLIGIALALIVIFGLNIRFNGLMQLVPLLFILLVLTSINLYDKRWLEPLRDFFRYHSAEHQAFWAYKKGLHLTVVNVAMQPTVSPTCGSVPVFFVSPLFFVSMFYQMSPLQGVLSTLALIFLSIHLIKRYLKNPNDSLAWPIRLALAAQPLVLRPPEQRHQEAAIAALQALLQKAENPR
jgi:uncharacterized protein YqhQ